MNKKYILLTISALALFASFFGDADAIDTPFQWRYVMIHANPSHTDYLVIAELQVFSDYVNVAQWQSCSESSHVSTYDCSYALDWDINNPSIWAWWQTDNTDWIEVDLGSIQDINSIVVWNRQQYTEQDSNFTLFVSPTSMIWTSYSALLADTSILNYDIGTTTTYSNTWTVPWTPWSWTWTLVCATGATWATWATWETWATWATWPQWLMWLSAYDLAVAYWFSGSEIQWLLSLQWSGANIYYTNTWTSTVVVQMVESTWWELSQSWLYMPISVSSWGTTYVDWTWVRNILSFLAVFIWVFYFLLKFALWRKSWLQ